MSHAVAMPTEETRRAAEIVERFLVASMVPDPETAARYISPDLRITFTGGRKYGHPRETTAFNAKRYKWVKKRMERTDVVAGTGETIVYNLGTLYGEWPDGTPFEGNRYIDRFVVKGGKQGAFRFLNALKLVLISNNLGDAKSLITHPATTTHQRLTPEARAELGITDGLVRLSVGLEHVDDIAADLTAALEMA